MKLKLYFPRSSLIVKMFSDNKNTHFHSVKSILNSSVTSCDHCNISTETVSAMTLFDALIFGF